MRNPVVSVTKLARYERYLRDDEDTLENLLRDLRGEAPSTPQMQRGSAWAAAMELFSEPNGESLSRVYSKGHTFLIDCDGEVPAYPLREHTAYKDYSGITVVARCDRKHGMTIEDDKTTGYFDEEKYVSGYEWRYYLDVFGAHTFRWRIWVMGEEEPYVWRVKEFHVMEQYRYPSLHQDCADLAEQFKQFAEEYLWH